MVAIPNQHRDELVRFVRHFCAKCDRGDLMEYNMCRRAAKIAMGLAARRPLPTYIDNKKDGKGYER